MYINEYWFSSVEVLCLYYSKYIQHGYLVDLFVYLFVIAKQKMLYSTYCESLCSYSKYTSKYVFVFINMNDVNINDYNLNK